MTICALNSSELENDTLSLEEWDELEQICLILRPFEQLTKRLEGNAPHGHHGSVWEIIPTIEILLGHIEKMKAQYKDHAFLSTCLNLSWCKLDEYYSKLDDSPVYAAALFCNPRFRFDYFRKRWTTDTLREWQQPTLERIRALYEDKYKARLTDKAPQYHHLSEMEIEEDIFESFLSTGSAVQDEFETYCQGNPTQLSDEQNLFVWWANSEFPRLAQMAFDLLTIPAMSAETERVFSGTKLTISPSRNRLTDDIIEATECLNKWFRDDE